MHGVQWFARDRAGSRGLADPKHPAVRGRARIFLALVAVGGFACASGDDPYGGTGRERRDGGASERDSGMLDARVEPPPRDAGGGTRDVGCVPERCNGVDDDCNGRADDGFACVGGTRESCRTASGAPGERTCEPDCSGWSPCRADEICNGMDDDGDGMVDDGFACARETSQPCTASTGARGVQACRADCSGWGPCAADEICNGLDDDGDGTADDGFGCARGARRACVTDSGVMGEQACRPDCSGWNACTAAEVCNGMDDDGDGTPDNGFACARGARRGCTGPTGAMGMQSCRADCSGWEACAVAEICNGMDDDGDGTPDNGFACVRGTSRSCTTSCMTAGTQSCEPDCRGFGVCRAALETCGNRCDDNGNGMVDEGCATAPSNDRCTSATALSPASGGTLMGTTGGAARDVTDCGLTGPEVFYRIDVPVRSLVYFDTFGTSYDTGLSLRASCTGAQIACEDDDCGTLQDQLVAVVNPGTYYLAVHARYSASTGPFQLRWQSFPVPTNGTPTRITGNGDYTGMTAGASSGWTSCRGSGVEGFHYFTMCPSTTRTVVAATCGLVTWDTVVSIADGTVRACEDDTMGCGTQSRATATLSGPGAFIIVVDSFGCCATNAYTLRVSFL